jgi:hypothetical protein
MASIELGGTMKPLKGEWAKVQNERSKLDKAITVLAELSDMNTSNGHHKRTLFVAALNKIAEAQKMR